MALVCRGCQRELLSEEMPDDPRTKIVCPQCGASEAFVAVPDPAADPRRPYYLTTKDKKMLKSFRIKVEAS